MSYLVRSSLASLAVVLAACGGGDSTGPDDLQPAVGVYALQTINGDSLPVVVDSSGNDTAEFIGGVVKLFEDGTFLDILDLRFTIGGVVTTPADTAEGTWSRDGGTIIFAVTGGSYTMAWDGTDRLTQVIDGPLTLQYER